MKIINLDGIDITIGSKKQYLMKLRLAMFLAVYWLWCFSFFIAAVVGIVNGAGVAAVISGIINLLCLFLCATWIEDLFNESQQE